MERKASTRHPNILRSTRVQSKTSGEGKPTQQFLHDGNPVDGENQVMNNAGILKKIGARLLSFWIIIPDFQRAENSVPKAISEPLPFWDPTPIYCGCLFMEITLD